MMEQFSHLTKPEDLTGKARPPLSEFTLSRMGKILKRALRERIAAQLERERTQSARP